MEHLPTPFTAEQIGDACRGRRVRIVTEAPDCEPLIQVTEFLDGDAERAVMRTWTAGPDGSALAEPTEQPVTWEALRLHAAFPADGTDVAEEHIVHPLGELDTMRYTLGEPDRQRILWFAAAYPGMPVRQHTFVAGKLVSSTNVVESVPIAP